MLPREEADCCKSCSTLGCCSRRCLCISAVALVVLAIIAVAIACATTFAIPARTPVNRYCMTSANLTGFLCDDRVNCIPASEVCNGMKNCLNGEDEEDTLCRVSVTKPMQQGIPVCTVGNLPKSLPGYLLFWCGNGINWIYNDEKCNGYNNCGDCSDEIGTLANCPPCGPQWWSCTSIVFEYCSCIPRSLCGDGIQHCSDWSDQYVCKN
ncbi:low-density lipoprotein receptor class A domain-containing protein 1 isoform X2 [Ambystoma mexicanum]|uniref:low-density lipoprotein receptor class A domain-containing protein 1 isoform X2 n=1 Tax=Ambystoma mexicanum TaxID=8296 RepID=UPI0037E8701E